MLSVGVSAAGVGWYTISVRLVGTPSVRLVGTHTSDRWDKLSYIDGGTNCRTCSRRCSLLTHTGRLRAGRGGHFEIFESARF